MRLAIGWQHQAATFAPIGVEWARMRYMRGMCVRGFSVWLWPLVFRVDV